MGNNSSTDSPQYFDLRDKVNAEIDQAKSSQEVADVSVYMHDFKTGGQFSVNGDDKYFPASLTKVPLMISYFKRDEAQPGYLNTKVQWDLQQDYNVGQEIKPANTPVAGQSYSVEDLMEMMIESSDNASFHFLISAPGAEDQLKRLYSDVHLYYPFDQVELSDVMTPRDFAVFLRILYNSTYLSSDNSEKVLGLMSKSEFKDGLVAGVPKNIAVAHKFGLNTQLGAVGKVMQRELHDCGIVYGSNNTYILCVMTKSHADLPTVEHVIQQISRTVYQGVNEE